MMIVNRPALDWVTMTTWEAGIYRMWVKELMKRRDWFDLGNSSRYENYVGAKVTKKEGTKYIGTGKQQKKSHYLSYISGALADKEYKKLVGVRYYDQIRPNCSRVDIQVTVESPDGWNQMELLNRLHKNRLLVTTDASMCLRTKREQRTVYVGNKNGEKLIRIYDKQDDKYKQYLRFEVQYRTKRRGGKGNEAFWQIMKDRANMGRILSQELAWLYDDDLTAVFHESIEQWWDNPMSIRATRYPSTKRAEWLENSVIPALTRYLSENKDPELVTKFLGVLVPNSESDRRSREEVLEGLDGVI